MRSNTYLSAKIKEDEHVEVNINGPVSEVLPLLEEEAVAIFKLLDKAGSPDTLDLFCLFFKNVAKEVFDIDL